LDLRGVRRLGLGERFAAAGIAVRVLGHQRLAYERDRGGPFGFRLCRSGRLDKRIRGGSHAFSPDLGRPRPDIRARLVGRRQQRAEEREAAHGAGMQRRKMRGDDGAHGVRDDVRLVDAGRLAGLQRRFDESRDGKRTLDPARAAGARQIEAHALVARKSGAERGPRIRGPAQPMDHDDRLALAVDLHGQAPRPQHPLLLRKVRK
jgi:hypothetical protein